MGQRAGMSAGTQKLDLHEVVPRKEVVRKTFIASLAVAGALALGGGLWLGATSGKTTAGWSVVAAYGVSLELPSGWIGRIYDGNRGTPPPYAFLQATSFTGAGPDVLSLDDDNATRVGEQMGARDILILLWETTGGGGDAYKQVDERAGPKVSREDFSPLEGFAHPVARTLFTTNGRFFVLMVYFGTASSDTADLARANDLLATLRIEPRKY